MKHMKKVILLLVAALIILGGCQLAKGSIELNIAENVSAKTLLPSIDMAIASYEILGYGPEGDEFTLPVLPGEAILIEELAFGPWDLDVLAYNALGELIGQGAGSTVVYTGETSELNILVTVLDGKGTIDLTVNWTADDTQFPWIDSAIIPVFGSDIFPEFEITGGNKGTYENRDMETGYSTVIVKLMDNTELTMGAVEVARIVKDQTTYGVFDFLEINEPGGSLMVNIETDMNDPIDVSLVGGVDLLLPGESMTLEALIPADMDVVYLWYINGDYVDLPLDNSSFLFEDYDAGIYRIDVTVFTVDGEQGGSATFTAIVVDGGILTGRVGTMVDNEFRPLEGAMVGVATEIEYTTENGYFRFWDIDIDIEIRIRIILRISFPGYRDLYRPVIYEDEVRTDLGDFILLPDNELLVQSGEDNVITNPSGTTSILIPANSFETEAGLAYEGEVLVRMNGIIPSEPGFYDAFMGDFSGIRADGEEVPFESFGFVTADFFMPDGERLALMEGTEVELRALAPDPETPPLIPTWSFDPDEGLWRELENSEARLEGDQLIARLRINIRIRIRFIINIDIEIRIN